MCFPSRTFPCQFLRIERVENSPLTFLSDCTPRTAGLLAATIDITRLGATVLYRSSRPPLILVETARKRRHCCADSPGDWNSDRAVGHRPVSILKRPSSNSLHTVHAINVAAVGARTVPREKHSYGAEAETPVMIVSALRVSTRPIKSRTQDGA